MAVPRNRHSNARKNSKRAHHARKAKDLSSCRTCGSVKLPHRVCASCGNYRGRVVIAGAAAGDE